MSTSGPNETAGLAWGKILIGVGVLILGASFAFAGGPWWQLVTAAVVAALGLVLLITGLRDRSAYRQVQLKAQDEQRID